MGSADPRRDRLDQLGPGRAKGLLELGGEGYRQVEGADAQGRGLEREEMLLGQAGNQLGTEAMGAPALVQDDQAVRAVQ